MEFSKPTEQKDLQDYGAGDEAQEARLQEHRTPRPALKHRPSFPARLEPFRKLLVSKERTADTQRYCTDLSQICSRTRCNLMRPSASTSRGDGWHSQPHA